MPAVSRKKRAGAEPKLRRFRAFFTRERWARNNAYLLVAATWRQMLRAQLLMVASSLAYITILSIVPMLAVSFAIFQTFGGMERLYGIVEPFILQNLAPESSDVAIDFLQKFLANVRTNVVGVGGFVSLVVTTMMLLANIEKAVNRVWETPIRRPLFQRFAVYWLFITLGPLALSVTLGVAESRHLPIARILPSRALLFLIASAIFFLIYKLVPNTKVQTNCAFFSALLTSAIWNLAGGVYGLYTEHIVSYSKIYGGLAAVPIFLLWIYILWVVTLGGAAFAAALQGHGISNAQGTIRRPGE